MDARTTTPSHEIHISNWHPMELFPYFRRFKPGVVRDLIFTFIWNMAFGVTLCLISVALGNPGPLGRFVWVQFVMTQTVGYSIHGLFDLMGSLFGRWLHTAPTWARTLYFVLTPVGGIYIGYWIGFGMLNMESARHYVFSAQGAWEVALVAIAISSLIAAGFFVRERQQRAEAALALQHQRALDAERRALEAQLRMLQAQIEPHFLYNTLANAVGLIAPAPDKARLLLERLIDYLRASLTESREQEILLGREFDTIRAYLDLMTVRMGPRLRYRIDCPDALLSQPLPPMLLQPIVENAIHHGLEPKIEGGEITITARAIEGMLEIEVADDGVGIAPTAKPRPGGGVGLSNLRERLGVLFGEASGLALRERQPCGVSATLRIPRQAHGTRAPQRAENQPIQ